MPCSYIMSSYIDFPNCIDIRKAAKWKCCLYELIGFCTADSISISLCWFYVHRIDYSLPLVVWQGFYLVTDLICRYIVFATKLPVKCALQCRKSVVNTQIILHWLHTKINKCYTDISVPTFKLGLDLIQNHQDIFVRAKLKQTYVCDVFMYSKKSNKFLYNIDVKEYMYFQFPKLVCPLSMNIVLNLSNHTDGLVQERCNSIANALCYVFLALTHWYELTALPSVKLSGCWAIGMAVTD